MLSSTTNVIVCDVDLNLDGQEFAALRSEQRDPVVPRRRAAAYTTTFSTASTSGMDPVRQHAAHAAATRGGGHRGAHSARHALGARHARSAHAARYSSVEAAARTTHATRSAHAMRVMVGVDLAASTRPRYSEKCAPEIGWQST